ncbi:hypothetical protein [Hymenobacter metallicola]|uniref:Uncharacterized protein n=1 Tax=Hymenobacter metallicola TaxID=2563114 RepID=A0A4Z0QJU9_9BACT|nr:hypothetical protein [Hymenobacter metallicola]TGE29786.1 hypothetical protein E5K02_10105 [Hymenobacter metallicola]
MKQRIQRPRTGFLEDALGNSSSAILVAWLCLGMLFAIIIRGMFIGSIEQAKMYQYPPREITICLATIIVGAFALDNRLAFAVAKGDAGGYEQVPESQSNTTLTGDKPNVTVSGPDGGPIAQT